MLQKSFYIFFIAAALFFTGCEKEIGDSVIVENLNPYEGSYVFTVTSELSGFTTIGINNRGNFSFLINVNSSSGGTPYPLVITGTVNLTGQLDGFVFYGNREIGYVRGQLGGGDFYFNDNSYIVQGRYIASAN